jgi:hypothetical protein
MTDWADEIAKEKYLDWPSVAAALRKARQDALEEAATVCDAVQKRRAEARDAEIAIENHDDANVLNHGVFIAGICAKDIRALKDKQP